MATTAIFIVTDAAGIGQLPQLNDRFLKLYNPTPLGPWQLEHRLLRSADTPTTHDAKTQPCHQEFLTLSHHPGKAFVAIDGVAPVAGKSNASGKADGDKATKIGDAVIAIPAQQRDGFLHLILNKMGALWNPRTTMGIQAGAAYDAGEYIVRMGELKQLTTPNTTRALVTCIQSNTVPEKDTAKATEKPGVETGDQEDQQGQSRKEAVQKFWKSFGIDGAKEAFCVSNQGDDGLDEIRLWCEALRLRP